ncbi:TetR/AcrR family transcriptional regulator [Propionibacteriaceae bacterium Y1685]
MLDAARERANTDGWAAVTTRHLAEVIGFTQPVLYGHFPGGKTEIMLAVATEGFVELTRQCRVALDRRRGTSAIEAVATAYLDFGRSHPAVYEAMFQQTIEVPFASADTPTELRAAFDLLAETVGDSGDGTTTELFWASLHGLSTLDRAGRLRPRHRRRRVAELAALFSAQT